MYAHRLHSRHNFSTLLPLDALAGGRTGNDTIDMFPEPHITVCDLNEVADRLIATYKC